MPVCQKCNGVTSEGDVCQYCRTPFDKASQPMITNVTINNYGPSSENTASSAETGTAPSPNAPVASTKSWWTTFVLCGLLGMFGAHRFYTGKVGTGFIWLFTGGCLLIGWIVDLVSILAGRFADKSGGAISIPAGVTPQKKRGAVIGIIIWILLLVFVGSTVGTNNSTAGNSALESNMSTREESNSDNTTFSNEENEHELTEMLPGYHEVVSGVITEDTGKVYFDGESAYYYYFYAIDDGIPTADETKDILATIHDQLDPQINYGDSYAILLWTDSSLAENNIPYTIEDYENLIDSYGANVDVIVGWLEATQYDSSENPKSPEAWFRYFGETPGDWQDGSPYYQNGKWKTWQN